MQKVHFWSAGHLQVMRVKFVYEGHRVKVKVTAANCHVHNFTVSFVTSVA